MKVKNVGDSYYLRIDKGEEIITSIKAFCNSYNIETGVISGLGSVTEVELGLFDLENKEYLKKEIKGIFEIASMNGNISRMDNEPYLHIHAVISDSQCNTYGGHFARGVVGATCEVVIIPFNHNIGRFFSEEIGLNLLDI